MGKQQSKEENIVIAQNAAGGTNNAPIDEFRFHMKTSSILLCVIVLCLILGVLYGVFRIYRKCHLRWIRQEFEMNASDSKMRQLSFRRRQGLKIDDSKV